MQEDSNYLIKILVGVAFFIALLWFVGFFNNEPEMCECFEVVGDEDNFVCYTPQGELDTEGDCNGPKVYK